MKQKVNTQTFKVFLLYSCIPTRTSTQRLHRKQKILKQKIKKAYVLHTELISMH